MVIVSDEKASEDALNCAAKAVDDTGYMVFFDEDDFEIEFYKALERITRPRQLAISRNWLAARDLLASVPDFATSGLSDVAFAKKIESICGPNATGAFDGSTNPHQFSYVFLEQAQDDDKKKAAFECILHVTIVSGFGTGFVGNEAVQ